MKYIIIFLLLIAAGVRAQDEFTHLGSYRPDYFAELLDVEVYSPAIIYTFGVGGFVLLSVSEAPVPKMIGRYNPGNIFTQRYYNGKAQNSLAIGAARLSGLHFISIQRFENPRLLKVHGKTNFSYESVDFRGNYAYAAVHENGLEVINISDPENPQTDKIISLPKNAWDVYIDGDNLYVADGKSGLLIFAISEAHNPQYLATIPTSASAKEVIVKDDIAYVALGAGGVDIIDVSDPSVPQLKSNFNARFGIVNHLDVDNGILYAATWELVLAIDVSDPAQPFLLATEDTPTRAMGLAADNGTVYVSDWLSVETYQFADLKQPDIHVKPKFFDFGFNGLDVPVSQPFEIYNLGEDQLDVSGFFVDSDQFTVSPASLNVPAGGMASVDVTFTPQKDINLTRNLEIYSNDPDEAKTTVRVAGGTYRLSPGDEAPGFSLRDLSGITHNLNTYRGKVVILAFFASW